MFPWTMPAVTGFQNNKIIILELDIKIANMKCELIYDLILK